MPTLVFAAPDRSEASDGLPPLPGALEDARRIAELLPAARVLTGGLATRGAFLAQAPGSEILHIATHTQPDLSDPLRSRILAAADTGGNSITTSDLVSLRLDRCRLAVLSSCESGRGYESRLSGSIALSRGFLAAGIPQVVNTMWSIDDRTAVAFAGLFYDALVKQRDVAAALETAQRRAADSGDSALAAARSWAAYQLTAAGGAAEVN
jgi:CHAT domain-containing protein